MRNLHMKLYNTCYFCPLTYVTLMADTKKQLKSSCQEIDEQTWRIGNSVNDFFSRQKQTFTI
jgi:hypothetical protein